MKFDYPKKLEKFVKEKDPYIKKLAIKLTKNSKTPVSAAKKLFIYVRDSYPWNAVKIVKPSELVRKKGSEALCTSKTLLFVSLCRSIGIPARVVIMNVTMRVKDKSLPKKVPHTPAEIYINGKWKIVDPAFGKHSQKIMEISSFDKPSWHKPKIIMRLKSLPLPVIILTNTMMKYSPDGKKMRAVVKKTRRTHNKP